MIRYYKSNKSRENGGRRQECRAGNAVVDISKHNKGDLAVMQSRGGQMVARHLFDERPIGVEVPCRLILRRKVRRQRATNSAVPVGDLEGNALIGVPGRPDPRLNRYHVEFHRALSSVARTSQGRQQRRTHVCSLYVERRESLLGVCGEIKLVMHLMADGDRCRSDRIHVGRARFVGAEGPFAVIIKGQRHAGDASAPRSRSDALNSDRFEFVDGLLRSLHFGLRFPARSRGLGYARQAGAA